uniref:Phosphoribulokinase/uridine kinase domain-containing protein n=1 Tax=Trichobilharzia regenti TaxID=157069 RepID=A0AA85KF05_TRIRE|nr:unnamed protein product [Trichobilharzia regenti]
MNGTREQYIIGIAGGSNTGKTTVTKRLCEHFKSIGYDVTYIAMDDYYLPYDDERHVRNPVTNAPNYDCEAAINWDGLISVINIWNMDKTYNGKPKILIIEGIMIMNIEEIRKMLDLRLFFRITYENMRKRRKMRRYIIEDPPSYFEQYVWPSYVNTVNQLAYIKDPPIKYFDSNDSIDRLYAEVYEYVNQVIFK